MEISAEDYLEKKLLEKPQKPLVLYLHVPFCNKNLFLLSLSQTG